MLLAQLRKHAGPDAAEPSAQIDVELLQLARGARNQQRVQSKLQGVEQRMGGRVDAQLGRARDVVREEKRAVASVSLGRASMPMLGKEKKGAPSSRTRSYRAFRGVRRM